MWFLGHPQKIVAKYCNRFFWFNSKAAVEEPPAFGKLACVSVAPQSSSYIFRGAAYVNHVTSVRRSLNPWSMEYFLTACGAESLSSRSETDGPHGMLVSGRPFNFQESRCPVLRQVFMTPEGLYEWHDGNLGLWLFRAVAGGFAICCIDDRGNGLNSCGLNSFE